MELIEAIAQRASVRSYQSTPVEPEKLQQVLTAARLAPTACNLQAFKVVVVKTAGRGEELKRIYSKDWFSQAPYVLCVCALPEKGWVRNWDRKNYVEVDATIVMDHMILTATALGLGTCWIAAFDPRATREVLHLDETWVPVAFTPLGYSDEKKVNRNRKPLEELVIYQ